MTNYGLVLQEDYASLMDYIFNQSDLINHPAFLEVQITFIHNTRPKALEALMLKYIAI